MSISLMAMIFNTKGQFTPLEKLVMLELADHANDQGEGVWPGAAYIQERTDIGETAVRDILTVLTEAKILVTEVEHTATTSTRRRINIGLLAELQQAGQLGITHQALPEAKKRITEAKAARKKAKEEAQNAAAQAEEGVPSRGTVPPNGTGEYRDAVQGVSPDGTGEYRLAVHPVPPGGPESSLNHQLNPQEPSGESSGGAEPKIPTPVEAWECILTQLRQEMSRADYDSYVKSLFVLGLENGALHIGAVNSYTRDWASTRLGKKVSQLAAGILMQPVEVRFRLATPPAS